MKHLNQNGLSLIELMIVMLIITSIAILGTVKWLDVVEGKKVSAMQLQAYTLEEALNLYSYDHGHYPSKSTVSIASISEGTSEIIKAELKKRGLSTEIYYALSFKSIDQQKISPYLKTFVEDLHLFFFIDQSNVANYNNVLQGRVFILDAMTHEKTVFSGASSLLASSLPILDDVVEPGNPPIEEPEEPGPIAKSPQAAPSAPVHGNITDTSIHIVGPTSARVKIQGQTESFPIPHTFSGLIQNTSYTFVAYFPETETHLQSPTSSPLTVSTLSTVFLAGFKTIDTSMAHTLGIKHDNSLWGWGRNSNYELGLGHNTAVSVPTRIGTDNDWAEVAAANVYSLARKIDGRLFGWGTNNHYNLGLGHNITQHSPVQIAPSIRWKSVSATGNHVLAIDDADKLWSWGWNFYGQVAVPVQRDEWGLPTPTASITINTPRLVHDTKTWKFVSAGSTYSLAIDTEDYLWSFGDNSNGALGLGDYVGYYEHYDEWDEAYYYVHVGVETPMQVGSQKWKKVSAGHTHSLGIQADNSLFSFGLGHVGQLGHGNFTSYSTPRKVGSLSTWSEVAAGYAHSLAIQIDGSLWGFGHNMFAELGLGTTGSARTSPTRIGTLNTWKTVKAGNNYSLGLLSTNETMVWGNNDLRQLGLGDITRRTVPTKLPD